MRIYTSEEVYDTLCGEVHGVYAVPGVENAYTDGAPCDTLYNEMSEAYERLRDRLGVVDEDADVEIIINNLMAIQRILCEKMFRYGQLLR